MSDIDRSGPGGSPALTPPQALEAERSVLAAMLLDETAIGRAIEMIDASTFYRTSHAKLFDAVVALYNTSTPADLITVSEELKKRGDLEAVGGPGFLAQIMEYASTTANIEQHIKIVHSKAILRALIKATSEIQQQCYAATDETADILDRSEARIFEITDNRIRAGFVNIRDLLKPTFDNIQKLFERKVQVTGVPTGWDDLDKLTSGWQPGDLVILAGRPAMGKCVSWRTQVVDPATGERLSIEEAIQRRQPMVHALDDDGVMGTAKVGDWIDSGVKPCFRVTTRLGRTIEVTGHHPFLGVNGWTPLHDLKTGDCIAVPRILPVAGHDESWSLERIRLLAYFIAESGLTPDVPHFTTADLDMRADFAACLEREFPQCAMFVTPDQITFRIARKLEHLQDPATANGSKNPVKAWLTELEWMGKKSESKRLPGIVWRWDHARLGEFLRILFSCDGTIHDLHGYPRIEFTVASESLARDVQHALLRFGIVSKCWHKTEQSWGVEVTAPEEVARYQEFIGWLGEKQQRFAPELFDADPARRHACAGGAPSEAWAKVRAAAKRAGSTLTQLARATGEATESGYNAHTSRALRHESLERCALALADPQLAMIASEDLYWDEIVEIASVGPLQVYDLNVPDGANFVANDICVHNTSAAMNMAENAAIRFNIPVAVFSLEMSKEQLAMRMLCSAAEVGLHKVRTGYLGNEDWPRLTTGAGLLTQAPIMIDDSPAQSVLEIRAKCRRLKAEGRLGLVVIDYLQLMRSSTPAENRVQEISQISRGLKGLAKELGVPIIALSQLSRAVEQRGGGGRPQLSDLRDSGSIEQDADIVMFVYREVVYKPDTPEPGKAQIIIAKQRNGPTDDVDMTFLRECTKFVPYSPIMSGETEPGF